MKCLLINFIVFVNVVNSDTDYKPLILPQLPVGKYRLNFLAVMRCPNVQTNNKFLYNVYLSKTSINTTEILGNVTNSIPFDDSLNFEVDMAIKDSIGGWKENAALYRAPKACTLLKTHLGKAWFPIVASFGVPNATCPISTGTRTTPGLDTAVFSTANFPKTFFYGTYRLRFYYTKNKEVFGCLIVVLEIKRPWETN